MAIYNLDLDAVTLSAIPAAGFAALGVKEREHLQRALQDKIEVIAPGVMVLTEE